jgi:hypothetical protein
MEEPNITAKITFHVLTAIHCLIAPIRWCAVVIARLLLWIENTLMDFQVEILGGQETIDGDADTKRSDL